jgi:D-alanyl-D-alanine carboxypeptidase (penicillin-binding protein 5/6)
LFGAASALGAESIAPPRTAAPDVAAKAFYLIDFDSGEVLAEKNPDQRFEPGSLTKIMTSYVVDLALRDGRIRHSDPVTVSATAWRMGGTRMFTKVGSQVVVDELLKGMIVQSGNDATVALAEHVAGSEPAFAERMNEAAERLGMAHTRFTNSTGISSVDHYTTARDLATLSRALIRDFPASYPWYAIKEYSYNGVKQYNGNRLLWRDPSADGIKAGRTAASGYGLVASAQRGAMRLISVVLGAANDDTGVDASQRLLGYGFREFETHRLYAAQDTLTEAVIWKGDKDKIALGLISDMYVTIPKGQYDNLRAEIDFTSRIVAPTLRGQPFGTVTVSIGDEVFAEKELVSLETVAPGGFVNNLVDNVRLMLER